jgi:hypothetical protein
MLEKAPRDDAVASVGSTRLVEHPCPEHLDFAFLSVGSARA